jgi:hypothetical protein
MSDAYELVLVAMVKRHLATPAGSEAHGARRLRAALPRSHAGLESVR